jgi:uncharacterized protein (TIGR02757 family)
MSHTDIREALEDLYATYNRREFVHPDPIEFLYDYNDLRDREIVGLVSSSLAYGRVAQVLKSVSSVLSRIDPPWMYLKRSSRETLESTFSGFKHRFTTGEELAAMLYGATCVIKRFGSLYECFASGLKEDHETIQPALSVFVERLTAPACGPRNSLLPPPIGGSACKRLHLFLRWMVRKDDVDPGGWEGVPASKLIVPLDVHMHRFSLALNLTRRKQADIRTAREVTDAFRRFAPDDPVRYDFALTRLGIRNDADGKSFLNQCASPTGKQHLDGGYPHPNPHSEEEGKK